ncbi:MAG: DUF4302 domain-containing protein [Bacteroidota bacterium]
MKIEKVLIGCFSVFALVLGACESDDDNLPSVEERVANAVDDLRDDLTEPANGWRLDYQPAPGTGLFYILLDFDDDGQVTIKSDVPDSNGEFFEQTITYRIDNGLALELILETYGVFHYLFEKDQSSFGGEFEFLFENEDGDDLIFRSKSDVGNTTRLVFTPAISDAESLLSRELATNFAEFNTLNSQIFGGDPPVQQLILMDNNVSIFWSIDLEGRVIQFDLAGTGTTIEEVLQNNTVALSHTTGYSFLDEKLILIDPATVTVNGEQFNINELELADFSVDGEVFCDSDPVPTAVYNGSIEGVGSIRLQRSFFDSGGLNFQPMTDVPYSVNVIFVFDAAARSLAEEGSIFLGFPDAVAFVFNFGLVSDTEPANAVGFILEDDQGNRKTYLREFEVLSTLGNELEINLLDSFYYSDTPTAAEEEDLEEITNEIFQGGTLHVSDLPTDGLDVFRLFNTCNQYEIFLVR